MKVSNQSAGRQTGKVRLGLADAVNLKSVDKLLGNSAGDQSFDIPAGESKSFSWKLTVPDGLGFLTYKAVGSSGRLSDGEEGYLPVLARRVLVTESLPLPLRGKGTKEFEFTRLFTRPNPIQRATSRSPCRYSRPRRGTPPDGLLPYPVMESQHECTGVIPVNWLYANVPAARYIAGQRR